MAQSVSARLLGKSSIPEFRILGLSFFSVLCSLGSLNTRTTEH